MFKLIISLRKPTNHEQFEENYNKLLALVEKMPAIIRRQVVDVHGSPGGETSYHRILEVYFEDKHNMELSMMCQRGQQTGEHLATLPAGSFEIFFGEVYEEEGGSTPPSK